MVHNGPVWFFSIVVEANRFLGYNIVNSNLRSGILYGGRSGQDNYYVFRELLSLSDEEFAELVSKEIIY